MAHYRTTSAVVATVSALLTVGFCRWENPTVTESQPTASCAALVATVSALQTVGFCRWENPTVNPAAAGLTVGAACHARYPAGKET